ncbi:hypothetical protein FGG08_003202 [Glutinoglossum americanum]|uniref:Uncharacterized protein n=1 Tax=Glutinoglossum americanum TaxID=1670608 RepID=A0A9P8KYC1_9PEZI|nr:hypothetical protein FGG08_003202 [Glutinoglossum americanum]
MGGAYEFVSAASANLREKDDSWNPSIGGFFAGSVMGLRFRTIPAVLGYGAGLAVLMGTYDYTGGKLTGYSKDPDVDEFDRKEYLRKNRRRPIQETIDELGEGRETQASTVPDTRKGDAREFGKGMGLRHRPSHQRTHDVSESGAWRSTVCYIARL